MWGKNFLRGACENNKEAIFGGFVLEGRKEVRVVALRWDIP